MKRNVPFCQHHENVPFECSLNYLKVVRSNMWSNTDVQLKCFRNIFHGCFENFHKDHITLNKHSIKVQISENLVRMLFKRLILKLFLISYTSHFACKVNVHCHLELFIEVNVCCFSVLNIISELKPVYNAILISVLYIGLIESKKKMYTQTLRPWRKSIFQKMQSWFFHKIMWLWINEAVILTFRWVKCCLVSERWIRDYYMKQEGFWFSEEMVGGVWMSTTHRQDARVLREVVRE